MSGRTEAGRRRRRRIWATALSLAAHLAIPLAIVVGARDEAPRIEPEPIVVSLVRPPPPPPPPPPPKPPETPKPGGSPAAAPAKAAEAPPRRPVRRAVRPPPPDVEPLLAPEAPPVPVETLATVGEAALVGARTAGSGRGSGTGTGSGVGDGGEPCDMVRRLQAALRRDPEVRAAVAQAHRTGAGGRAILVWDGDWIRSPGEAGKGLAGVRQAIVMEVAFAPEACRQEAMAGLVLLSMSDSAGAPRLVLGRGAWRWTDLLGGRARR
ncbi:hypothetical protein [Phenylobacterium zucineum]|nr:hypothetical protein [Phenylobacterium zucineum]